MLFLKRTLPLIIAFVVGITGIFLYYIPHSAAQALTETLARFDRIVATFALVLGLYSLLHMHYTRISRKQQGWAYSLFVYIGFLVMFAAAMYNSGMGPMAPRQVGGPYDWMFQYVYIPAESTMFAILAFFIASAAYRTFRARTTEAAILLVAAVIVMLGRVPIGHMMWDQFPELQQWLMMVPNMAAKRGILLGVYLGAVATALRIIFGIERSYLGGDEE
jgi:hypothetical protein